MTYGNVRCLAAIALGSLLAVAACASAPPPPPPPPPPPMAPSPPPPPPKMIGAQLDITGEIEFALGKSDIQDSEASQDVLSQVLKILQTTPGLTKLRIEGHTDNTGNPVDNQKLSEARAVAVQDWLTNKGIAAVRLNPTGCAARDPLVKNDTPDHRAKNRRTEFDVEEMDGKQPDGFTAACAPNPSRT